MSQNIDYLLIGTITADIVPHGRILGGTVSYAARVAHSFGLNVAVLTSAVEDDPLLDDLRQYARVLVVPSDETTTYENIYTPEGRIQYVRGVCGKITREHVKAFGLTAPLVHLAPLADEVDPEIAFDYPDSQVLLTPQGWMRRWDETGRVFYKTWMNEAVLAAADLVVFSEEDVAHFPEMRQKYIDAAKHVAVTHGESGGAYYDGGTEQLFEAISLEPKDPTGAGDVFASSVLACLPRVNHDKYVACKVAARIASNSITRVGWDGAPTEAEVDAAIAYVTGN